MTALAAVLATAAPAAAVLPTSGSTIWTIAGTGVPCVDTTASPACGDGGPALLATFARPSGVAVGADGSVYVADESGNRIRKIDPTGVVTTIAGDGFGCFNSLSPCGDGGPATSAQLNQPGQIVLDRAGNIYFADQQDEKVRRIAPDGTITTVAGVGIFCGPPPEVCGDGGPATTARLDNPTGLAIDADGNLFVGELNGYRIRRFRPGGTITTVAGTGHLCPASTDPCGDGGPATSAQLQASYGLAVDSQGAVYVADGTMNRIRRFTPGGDIETIAGTGALCASPTSACGDGTPATSAQLGKPVAVAVDGAGRVYVADQDDRRIRRFTPGGRIDTIAGTGAACPVGAPCGDGGAAGDAQLAGPGGLAFDGAGDLLVADQLGNRLRWLTGPQPGPTGAGGSGGTPGATGPAGGAGIAGTPGKPARFGLLAFRARSLRGHRLRVSWVMTNRAPVALQVKPPHGRARTVARLSGKPGVNTVTWNGKLGRKAAPAGRYRLTIVARVGGRPVRSALTGRLR